jgi:exonuclease SbcD
MTKILHVSDTHLGNRQYRSDIRKRDFANGFDAAIDIALDERVDAVIHTGDLFDDPSPNVPTVNRCLDTIRRLADAEIPFHAIVGNHERKREEQWMDIVKRFGNTTRLTRTPTVVTDDDGNNPVSLYGIDAVRTPAWGNADFTLDSCPDDHVSLLCMHELLEPLVPPYRGDPYDLETDVLDRLNFLPDGLALGDYHSTCQAEKRGVTAFYPGATERCTVAETGEPSVYVLEIEDADLSLRTRTIESADHENVPRDFLVVNVEFEDGHGIEFVNERLHEEAGTDDLTEKVVVVRLRGADVPVSASDVYDLLADQSVAVSRVDDKRVVEAEFDFEFDEDEGENDIDQMLDESVSELDLSALTTEADDLVRSPEWEETSTEDIRAEMNARIRTAQNDRFDEATIEER